VGALELESAQSALVSEGIASHRKCIRKVQQLVRNNRRGNSCSVNPLHTRISCSECASFWKQSNDGGLQEDDDLRLYCINLDRRPDRWAAVQSEVQKLRAFAGEGGEGEIQLIRVPATDGRLLDLPVQEVLPEWDNSSFAEIWSDMQSGLRTLTPGEVGCALSHVEVWRRIAAGPSGMAGVVIEDDVIFEDEAALRLSSYIRQLPPRWELVYLGGVKMGRHKRLAPNVIVPECYLCTHAYMITPAGARKLLGALPCTARWTISCLKTFGKCLRTHSVLC